jgi:hypothetical protein
MTQIPDSVRALAEIPGALACALVDLETGRHLAQAGGADALSRSLMDALNPEMLRAEIREAQEQFPDANIEDLLITLGKQFHVYVVLAREGANLLLARRKMADCARNIVQNDGILQRMEIARFAAYLRAPAPKEVTSLKREEPIIRGEDDAEGVSPFMREEAVMKLARSMEATGGRAALAA